MPVVPVLSRLRRLRALLLLAAGACGGPALEPLHAEPPQSAADQGRDGVVVIGRPCPQGAAADCAAAKLEDAARAAQARAKDDPALAAPHAGSPDTTVGVGSLTGSSQRLGTDLRGATSLPRRPAPPPIPPSPYGKRP